MSQTSKWPPNEGQRMNILMSSRGQHLDQWWKSLEGGFGLNRNTFFNRWCCPNVHCWYSSRRYCSGWGKANGLRVSQRAPPQAGLLLECSPDLLTQHLCVSVPLHPLECEPSQLENMSYLLIFISLAPTIVLKT